MPSKIKIVTVNISPEKADSIALALRDMQDDIDTGWTIVGQSQYQNAISYTLMLIERISASSPSPSQVPSSIDPFSSTTLPAYFPVPVNVPTGTLSGGNTTGVVH